ncbi:non-ribosomal peptide synthetase/MFS transporter [Nonomuraea typhae]|uniref:non-ribosomal peptide synthetase/MFS transporter n=1 Tax=Nonomuraea typhae TaxID=2603600 RepID=UPI0012FBEF7C|nr:non-ribosomal peptide synthetase/MFS transporter [Nonomuraea typhae]
MCQRLIEAVAAHPPDAIAVADGSATMTYGRLYGTAAAVAGLVGAAATAGICARRGAGTVAAMLGTLMAGAAFVPLDPDDPPERLRVMADGAAVLTPEEWRPRFAAAGLRCLPIPGHTSRFTPEFHDDEAPAYVIHTSGSTGRPKGVRVHRGALGHFSAVIADGYGLAPGDRVLQFSATSFDGCIEEIFPPLLAGATVVIRDDEMISTPAHFLERAGALGLTVLHVPTAYWHELADAMARDRLRLPASVRVVSVGGEAMREDRLAAWRTLDLDPGVRLVNVYGPTETTVVATWDDAAGPRAVPGPLTIGRPLPGVLVRVADGELLIGGPTVGLGYAGLPELTAERFLTGEDGVRWYRTGDRVERLPDGRLVHLGRMDRQIKVRGFRVEAAEVEQALIALPGVRDAVVDYDRARQALVGYVLTDRAAKADRPDIGELRAALRRTLPAHAVPSLLIPVESFPMNARGKIDLPALAARDRPAEPVTGGPVAALVAEVLGFPARPDDSLFELGLHSLAAVRLVTRLGRELGVRLTLAGLYARPTLRGLEALVGDAPAAEPAASGTSTGLTAFQRETLLADELHPGTPMNTLGLRYRVTGVADPGRIVTALRRLAKRHEVLRAPDLEVEVLDREDDAARARRGRTVFDPVRGPLAAATLMPSGQDWELVFAVHHVAFDGWSAAVLADDLALLLGGGEPPHHHGCPPPADRDELAHWLPRLSGLDTELDLPADRPRPAVRSFAGARIDQALDPELLERLERAAGRAGTTVNAFVLAALQILLHRLTGRTDVTVLAPVARRDEPGSERAVGAFINIVPLRADLSGDPGFHTVLGRATEAVVHALSHPGQPLGDLARALGARARPDRGPLTQVMLIVVNTPAAAGFHGGAGVEHLGDTFCGWTKLDLTITLDFPPSGPVVSLEYATALFDEATVRRWLDHLLVLLAAAVDGPGLPISRLELLGPARRAEVLACAGPAGAPVTGDGGVHLLIEEHVERTPEAPAVQDWSYARLSEEAWRLAGALRERGVRPGDRVGIHLPRGPEVCAAVLAVWRAGGAYVPLDPHYPAERLRHMLADSGASALVTHADPGFGPPAVVYGEAAPAAPFTVATGAAGAAYVLYTSGTTGLPKGVVVTHANLRHAAAMWRDAYDLEPGLAHLQAASPSFDVFAGELLRALCTGGRLVVCPHETLLDPAALHELLRAERVAVAELVPAVLRGLLDVPGAGRSLHELRLLAGGADKWYVHEYRRALGLARRVVNSYGVTEATIDNAYFEGDVSHLPDQAPLPIGRPYPGNRLYVLDAHREPVPFGVAGELWIGGPGVARGYHERPGLTAERFAPDPFHPGGRMYRTGDAVRLRPGGVLEFLGRLDDQIKLNGHRIELDEVESALVTLPGVRQAAAAVRQGRLIGYVVGEPPADPRRALQEILPRHAIPAQTVRLAVLPLSANGKIDRRALPDPPAPEHEETFAEPRTDAERRMAALWREVLGGDRVGAADGFFERGGDSFSALRLVRAIERESGSRPALLEVYRRPVLRDMAALLAGEHEAATGLFHRLTPERAATRTLVCVPFSGGQAPSYLPLAGALPADWALVALQPPGRDWSRPEEPALPFHELAAACLEELRDVPGPFYLYGHCYGSALTVELARLAEEAGLPLAGVAIGGAFPAARLPGRLFDWIYRTLPVDRLISDRAVRELIRARGGDVSDATDPAEQAFVMRAIRHDDRGAEDYYATTFGTSRPKLRAPLLAVVGAKDRVTELHAERYREWEDYAGHVELEVIPKAGHQFIKHQPGELAAILDAWAARPAPEPRPLAGTGPRPSLRRFATVAAGQFVSSVGSALSQLVMSLWVFQQTGEITAFSLVMAVALLPGILAGPLAGAVADRYDRRTVMLLGDLAAGLSTLAMIGLIAADRLAMPYVYLLCAITSLATAFQRPAYLAAVAQLVPKPFLGHANGFTQIGAGAGALFAPMLGAPLLAVLPLESILLIDVATFLVAVATLAFVRFPDRLFRKREEPLSRQIVHGWRYIAKRPGLRAVLSFFVVDHVLYAAGFALIVPLVLVEYGVATLGLVLTAGGVGTLLGSLVMTVWGGTPRRADGMIAFMGLNNLGLLVIGAAGHPWLLVAGMFTMGFSESLTDGHWVALVQRKVGLELQGRVLATFMTTVTVVMPLAYLVIGPLADRLFRPMLQPGGPLAAPLGGVLGLGPGRGLALVILAGGVLLTAWTVRAWFTRRLRHLEDTLPDAVPDAVIEDRDAEQRRADAMLAAVRGVST